MVYSNKEDKYAFYSTLITFYTLLPWLDGTISSLSLCMMNTGTGDILNIDFSGLQSVQKANSYLYQKIGMISFGLAALGIAVLAIQLKPREVSPCDC